MRKRFALVVAAVTSMVVVAFVVPLALLVLNQAESRALSRTERAAQSVATALAVGGSLSEEGITPDLAQAVVDASDEADRITVYVGDVAVGLEVPASASLARALGGSAFTADAEGGAEVLIPVVGTGEPAVVRAFVTDAELRRGVVTAWALLLALGLSLVAVGLVVADRLARSVTRPVKELAEAADRMAEGDLEARVRPRGPGEIAEVAEAFNTLAERLDDVLAAERESLADLSHRLRTPLASLRLQAESLDEPERSVLMPDIDRLHRAVDRLIEDVRLQGDQSPRRADLRAMAEHRLAYWRVLADEQGRPVTASFGTKAQPVAIDPDALGAVIDALLENVFAHTPEGASFSMEVGSEGNLALLVIEDDGPGLGFTEQTERGISGGGSTGLGLDITRRTAERSGGAVRIGPGAGGGTRVEVLLGRPPGVRSAD